MQKTFTIKYDKRVCHGMKFELGNGKYHSLSFLIENGIGEIFLEKGSLFLSKFTKTQTTDSVFQFKRRFKKQFINSDAIWFKYDRTYSIFDSSFYLKKSRRDSNFYNKQIVLNKNINRAGIANSLIRVNIGEPQKKICQLENTGVAKYDKSIMFEESDKRIDYTVSDIDINNIKPLKEKDDDKYRTRIFEYIPVKNSTNHTFVGNTIKELKNKTNHVYKNKEMSLQGEINNLYRDYNCKLATVYTPNIFINNDIWTNFKDKTLSNMGKFYLLEGLTPDIYINEEKHTKASFDKTINMNTLKTAETRDKILYDLDYVIHAETNVVEINNIFSEIFMSKWYFTLNFENENKNLIKRDIEIDTNLSGIEITNLNSRVTFFESTSANKRNSKIDIYDKNSFASKCRNELNDIYNNFIFILKHSHRISFDYDIKQLSKIRPGIFKNDTTRSLTKMNRNISKQDLLSAEVDNYKLVISEHYKNAKVSSRKIYINKNDLLLDNAYYKDIVMGVGQESIALYEREINYDNNTIILDLDERGVNQSLNNYFVKKSALSIFQDDSHLDVGKTASAININNDIVDISKYNIPTAINDDYINIDKYYKPTFFIYDYTLVNKKMHHASIDDMYINVQKNMHHSMMNYEYLSINKNIHHARLDDYKDWVSKLSKHFMIDDNLIWIAKFMHHTGIDDEYLNISKSSKGVSSSDNLLVDRVAKEIETYHSETWMYKQSKSIQDEETMFGVNKFSKPIILYGDDTFVKYGGKGVNDDLGNMLLDTYSKPIQEIEALTVDSYSKPIYEDKNVTVSDEALCIAIMDFINLDEKIQHTWFYDYSQMLGSKTDKGKFNEHINLDSSLNFGMPDEDGVFAYKKTKDTNLFLPGEFVTVIHYDGNEKPDLKDSGIIDELILPHKDYKYSDFIKKLLNDDGTVNFQYVKSYDSQTGEYTVSIPVGNPVEIYADIGRDYLDLDVSTLELVVYIVKNIWKDNMYRYVSMSAQDSLKDILVKLDQTLDTQYELNYKKRAEALRCIQLFRWYAEMAILNNCDYVLKFDTQKAAVDYYNKDLGALADLIEFNNMHISDEYIIEPIVAKGKASIKFKNNATIPGPPLKLSFKLYNINTSSSISITEDGQTKVLTYQEGIHDLIFDLKEEILLYFNPVGQHQSINVANLFIDNISMRGFTVTYKGRFGELNAVMQEMLDNMLVIGTVPQSIRDRLKDVAPVTVAINKLLQYYELHHEEKLKGKRLITKK